MQAQVEQWIDFTTQEVDAPMLSWFLPIIGYMEYNKKVRPVQQCFLLSLHQSCIRHNFNCRAIVAASGCSEVGDYLCTACKHASLLTAPDLFRREPIHTNCCPSAEGGGSN